MGIWEVKQLGYHPKPLFSLWDVLILESQLVVNYWFLFPVVWVGSDPPYERKCYLVDSMKKTQGFFIFPFLSILTLVTVSSIWRGKKVWKPKPWGFHTKGQMYSTKSRWYFQEKNVPRINHLQTTPPEDKNLTEVCVVFRFFFWKTQNKCIGGFLRFRFNPCCFFGGKPSTLQSVRRFWNFHEAAAAVATKKAGAKDLPGNP